MESAWSAIEQALVVMGSNGLHSLGGQSCHCLMIPRSAVLEERSMSMQMLRLKLLLH